MAPNGFYEQVAKLTRAHINTHLRDYLDTVNALYDEQIQLDLPKRFDISTIVGGVVGVSRETTPAIAISANERSFSNDEDDVWSYIYSGQISGMVSSLDSANVVESLVRRYAGALETFINEHKREPVAVGYNWALSPFIIKGIGYSRTEFFGAANVEEGELNVWVDGFRIDLAWSVIEPGPGQHG